MKPLSTVLRCSFFMIVLLSCQQEQENLTSINQEGAYICGVWKAPTAKSAKEVIANVSAKIHSHSKFQSSPKTAQGEESQQQKNIKLNDSESTNFTESETVYESLPYSTVAAPETLLPKDGEVTDWVRSRKPTTYNRETLYQDRFMFRETYPEIYRNYGFQKQAEVEYQNPKFGSVPYILFEIFDMGTPENAFGIFSVHSYPQPKFEWIGCKAIISGKNLWFWKGKYFVQIEGYGIATGIREGMIALARVTAKRIQDPPQNISLLELLPTQYIRGSEKLFYTNWTLREVYKSTPDIFPQLVDKTIGILAQYRDTRSKKSEDSYIVFVIRFPNVADARSAYTQYSNVLMSEKVSFETDSQNGAILIKEQFAEP